MSIFIHNCLLTSDLFFEFELQAQKAKAAQKAAKPIMTKAPRVGGKR
jgi:hypothetical protein